MIMIILKIITAIIVITVTAMVCLDYSQQYNEENPTAMQKSPKQTFFLDQPFF